MIKLYCDRCKKEIKNTYFIINTQAFNINSSYREPISDTSYNYAQDTQNIIRFLKNRRLYCIDCKNKLDYFLCGEIEDV